MDVRFAIHTLAFLVWCLNLDADAQVYRCKTATGGTDYSQVPCGKDPQLLQSKRDSIDTTSPPADPFGVQRERDRLQSEADYSRKKSSGDMTGKSDGATSAKICDATLCY